MVDDLIRDVQNLTARALEEAGRDQASQVLNHTEASLIRQAQQEAGNSVVGRAFLREMGLVFRRGPGNFGFELWTVDGERLWSSTESALKYIEAMSLQSARLIFKRNATIEELYSRAVEREAEGILALNEELN